jgi:predicted kinase
VEEHTQNAKRLDLVRGLPGSGRTTLARELAGDTGRIFSHEDDLPRLVHGLTPEGMSIADGECFMDTAEAMAGGANHIVVERVFGQVYTMRELARLAQARGYEVQIHEPQTEWARDPRGCLERTSRSISTEDMAFASSRWDHVHNVEQVLTTRTPTERINDAKDAWAELAHMKETGGAGTEEFSKKFEAFTDGYAAEIQHLHYLKFFDPAYQNQVKLEMADRYSRLRQPEAERRHFSTPADYELDAISAQVANMKSGPAIAPVRKPSGPDLG